MWIEEITEELKHHIIPFWEGLMDEAHGGFYGYMDYDLQVDQNAEKGCILNSRITWFFSNAYLRLQDPKLLTCATHGYEFLKKACLDETYGGVYWAVSAVGNPTDTTKHTYNQAFAIYALCAYYEASKDEESLALAKELFHVIETRCTDAYGYLEAFTRDFQPESNEKLSENGVMAAKTMNTLLHVLEAYTQLYKLTKSEEVKACLYRIFTIIETKVYNPVKKRQEVFFDETYNTILDLHSYGHDIETAWLLDRALEVVGDEVLITRLQPMTQALANQTLEEAFNGTSFANECERGVVNTHRIWWVQAEAVVGFYNAWEKTGEEKFLTAAKAEWAFIRDHLIDRRSGSEWFWELDEEGTPYPNRPIVEPWKCPYHNGRMCFELMDRIYS